MSPARATPSASRRPLILIVDEVIALTGLSVQYSKAAAMEAGCDGFLAKPCYPDALAGEIRRVLRGWRRSH